MSTILQNSIWPNPDGNLGNNKTAIPDGVNVKWPEGDALIHNFVYKDGKLVGFVDTKALVNNETKSTTIPYDCVIINLDNILEDALTIIPGERCKSLTIVYANVVEFLAPKLKELLGETKFELYFENNIKKLIIHTDRISDEMVANIENLLSEVLPQTIEIEKYNHNMEISWRDINKYAKCATIDAVKAVNENYRNDLTSDKWWVYNLTSLKRAYRFFEFSPIEFFEGDLSSMNDGDGMFISTNIKKFNTPMPSLTTCSGMFLGCRNLETFDCNLDKLKMGGTMFMSTKLVSFSNALPVMTNGFQMFRFTPLEIFEVELPSLSNGGYMFQNCKLNKASALRVLNSIPAHTSGEHLLDIGIHVDHKTDDEVSAAIANAESKGWTLTVQWNGTPTSGISTLDLEEIWCKVTESEYGEYTDENGTRCTLGWGHYVTDTTGYKVFINVDDALKYWGLTKYQPSIEEMQENI